MQSVGTCTYMKVHKRNSTAEKWKLMNVLLQRFGLELQDLDPSFEFGHQCVQPLRSGSTAPNNRKADADTLKTQIQIMCT